MSLLQSSCIKIQVRAGILAGVHWLAWLLIGAGLGLADRLLRWAEDRDWIYYRTRPPKLTSVATALFQLQAIFEPEKQHIVEQQLENGQEGDEEGAPPPSPTTVTTARYRWSDEPDDSPDAQRNDRHEHDDRKERDDAGD